jgi:hypothetical protein
MTVAGTMVGEVTAETGTVVGTEAGMAAAAEVVIGGVEVAVGTNAQNNLLGAQSVLFFMFAYPPSCCLTRPFAVRIYSSWRLMSRWA